MSDETASGSDATAVTSVHRGPARPTGQRRRPALICAFPQARAVLLPDSGETIGRAWLHDRDLTDKEVSTAHLRFDRAGGTVRLTDVGSRNGTWVNGQRLEANEKVPLDDGAVVRIGRTLLVYRDKLEGTLAPADPVGELAGPYGLRSVARAITSLSAAGQRVSNVLLEGETGVGKELTAHAVAAAVGRAERFAAVNVAGVAAGVFESQMFGHAAGAFSGAGEASLGLARSHDGGTLFLDEIGELASEQQAKMLRLLDNREVLPVGAQRPERVDILVIAATHRELEHMVEAGTFRRDLLARISMARIRIPPLRERREDVFWVAEALARRAGRSLSAEDVEVEAVERLLLEPWPTNVRGLDATLLAVARRDSEPGLRLWALAEELGPSTVGRPIALTRAAVEAAIERAGGNATAAAKALGVSRGKLLRIRKNGS